MCVCIYACHVCVFVLCVCVCVCVHACMYVCVYMCACMYVCTCVCAYLYICVCVLVTHKMSIGVQLLHSLVPYGSASVVQDVGLGGDSKDTLLSTSLCSTHTVIDLLPLVISFLLTLFLGIEVSKGCCMEIHRK